MDGPDLPGNPRRQHHRLHFPALRAARFSHALAQYESWSLPLAIILIVPMCLLSAIAGVWLRGMDNNIFTQIGLIVLVGLASKNAILIVEFAKQLEDSGKSITEAAVEAARLRLRPILMTSFAFILGVVPSSSKRCGRGDAAGARNRSIFRNARCDLLWLTPYPGVLCRHSPSHGAEEPRGKTGSHFRSRS